MATLQELERALVNADRAGDMDAARKIAAVLSRARKDIVNQIPDTQVEETIVRPPEPTVGQKIVGAGEAALTTVTGATGGTVGMIGGTLKGLAEQILSGNFGTREAADLVEKSAMQGAQALTYMPRTQAGQEYAQDVGEVMQQVIPVTPLTSEMGMIGQSVRAAAPAVRATAQQKVAAPMQQAAQRTGQAVKQAIGIEPAPAATPGTGASIGAAGVDAATLRQAKAQELPVPIKLTEGQKTRTFEQQ